MSEKTLKNANNPEKNVDESCTPKIPRNIRISDKEFFDTNKKNNTINYIKTTKDGDDYQKICDHIAVVKMAYDFEGGNASLIINFSINNTEKQEVVAFNLLQSDSRVVKKQLADKGFKIELPKHFIRYVIRVCEYIEDKHICYIVKNTGWVKNGNYMTNQGIISGSGKYKDKAIYFQDIGSNFGLKSTVDDTNTKSMYPKFETSGTLEEYQKHVIPLFKNNSRLIYGLCVSLTSAFLHKEILDVKPFGVNFYGDAGTGKTLLLEILSSLFDKPNNIIHSWHQTITSMENLAFIHNDAPLFLDEIGQSNAEYLRDIIYLLGNGEGKGRANSSAEQKVVKKFKTITISSGEKTIAEHQAEVKKKTTAGQENRLIDIPATPLAVKEGQGVFEELHGCKDLQEFRNKIVSFINKFHGTIFIATINLLSKTIANGKIENIRETIFKKKNEILEKLKLNLPSKDIKPSEQELRILNNSFALPAAIGEYLAELNITGLDGDQIIKACDDVFKDWYKTRDYVGNKEHAELLTHILDFFTCSGIGCFININSKSNFPVEEYKRPPIKNFYGYYDESLEMFYIPPACFKKYLLREMSKERFFKITASKGLEFNRESKTKHIPLGNKKERLYIFKYSEIKKITSIIEQGHYKEEEIQQNEEKTVNLHTKTKKEEM